MLLLDKVEATRDRVAMETAKYQFFRAIDTAWAAQVIVNECRRRGMPDWLGRELQAILDARPHDSLIHYLMGEVPFVAGEALAVKAANILLGLRCLGRPRAESEETTVVIRALARLAGRCPLTLDRRMGRAFPITLRTLMIAAHSTCLSSPAAVQIIAFGMLAFSTVSRSGEVLALTLADVVKLERGYEIVVRWTKTRDRPMLKMVPDVGTGRDSPAWWLARHICNLQGPGPLWRSHRADGRSLNSSRERLQEKQLSRGDLMADVQEAFGSENSGHSFRRGAAVHHVTTGTQMTILQALGGWNSRESVLHYCEEAVRLSQSSYERAWRDASFGVTL